MERVVVTGMGVITPVGSTIETFTAALREGKNGIGPITRFDTSAFKASLAGEVRDFDPEQFIERKEARRMDRFCQLAVASAKLAMDDCSLEAGSFDPWRAGVIYGSGVGGLQTFETEAQKLFEKGPGRVSPFFIPMLIANLAAGSISMRYDFKGACICPITACTTATNALGEAMRAIRHGYLDIVITGGSEAGITQSGLAGFGNMTALSSSNDPNNASIPFDARRDGFVIGEGAGTLVLESLTHAKARGAKIYAELAGYGTTADAHHMTAPDPEGEGATRSMLFAIADAGLSPADVDYINAHGTSTPPNDRVESLAIKKAFGDHARSVAISSTKSMTGHQLGAAGAVEGAVCVIAINEGFVPPTINYREPDPECDLDYTPNIAKKRDINVAISNSFGFGGHNGTVLFKKYE